MKGSKPFCRLPRTATKLIPLALHAGLSTEEQLRVFEPAERGSRKIIISTNIAEVCTVRLYRYSIADPYVGQRNYRWDQIRH